MALSIRSRLTISFSLLFIILLTPFLGAIYYFLSLSLNFDLKQLTIHNHSQIMLVFEEYGHWDLVMEKLYREEADEFNVQVQLLNEELKPVFMSYGFKENPFSLEEPDLNKVKDGAFWSSGHINGIPHIILTQKFFPKDRPAHYSQIWMSKKGINNTKKRFLTIVFVGTPFIFGLSILAGLFFSKRALHPFEVIRQNTDKIQSDDLSTRLPYPNNKDETYKLTETLNGLLSRIEKSLEGMKRFTADASHELRIPLTNLRGMIEVALRKNRTPEEYQADLKDALEEVDRLSELVRSLLVLARIDAKKFSLEMKKINLKEFLEEFFKSVQILNKDKKFDLSISDIPSMNLPIDPERIKQILFILFDNAVKYNPPGEKITLSAQKKSAGVIISIQDTGKGISKEHHEKIFERFYRVDDSRDRKEGGTGLGLSIARSIAEAHNGTLTVESTLGQGSTFHLFLPIS